MENMQDRTVRHASPKNEIVTFTLTSRSLYVLAVYGCEDVWGTLMSPVDLREQLADP